MAIFDDMRQEIRARLREAGMPPPFRVIVIAQNGAMEYFRYSEGPDGDLEYETLSEYLPDGEAGYQMPINMIWFDALGKAARVIIDAEETEIL